MNCIKCSYPLDSEVSTCPECGLRREDSRRYKKRKRLRTIAKASLLCTLLAALVLCGVWAIWPRFSPSIVLINMLSITESGHSVFKERLEKEFDWRCESQSNFSDRYGRRVLAWRFQKSIRMHGVLQYRRPDPVHGVIAIRGSFTSDIVNCRSYLVVVGRDGRLLLKRPIYKTGHSPSDDGVVIPVDDLEPNLRCRVYLARAQTTEQETVILTSNKLSELWGLVFCEGSLELAKGAVEPSPVVMPNEISRKLVHMLRESSVSVTEFQNDHQHSFRISIKLHSQVPPEAAGVCISGELLLGAEQVGWVQGQILGGQQYYDWHLIETDGDNLGMNLADLYTIRFSGDKELAAERFNVEYIWDESVELQIEKYFKVDPLGKIAEYVVDVEGKNDSASEP